MPCCPVPHQLTPSFWLLRPAGPPQLRRAQSLEVVSAVRGQHLELAPAVRGQQAVLEQRFCADPAPSRVTWLWDDQRLQAGHARGRYAADEVVQVGQQGWVGSQRVSIYRSYHTEGVARLYAALTLA